jgi:hypothetical protein
MVKKGKEAAEKVFRLGLHKAFIRHDATMLKQCLGSTTKKFSYANGIPSVLRKNICSCKPRVSCAISGCA